MNITALIFARKIESYTGTAYDRETRTLLDVPRARYVAGDVIGRVALSTDGLYYVVSMTGTRLDPTGQPTRTRAMLAARRVFGKAVIVR